MSEPKKMFDKCVICRKNFYQATSLSMCLHTFCWKCIYGKITEHGWKYCPLCYANLGEHPLEQLRPNHLLESLKQEVESETETETETDSDTQTETDSENEVMMVIWTVSERATETDSEETETDLDTETETDSEETETDKDSETETDTDSEEMEVAKPPLVGESSGTMDLPVVSDLRKEVNVDNGDAASSAAERKGKKKVEDTPAQDATSSAALGKGKRKADEPIAQQYETSFTVGGNNKKKATDPVMEEKTQYASSPAPTEESNTPIWFTLFASNHQDSNAPLQQVPVPYLRVKDRNLPVSAIKKYIAMKLSLESEDEVELYLRNLRLDSSMMLHNLLDYWIRTTPYAERISARVGSSGAEFVMLLCYTRKSQPMT